MPGRMHQRRDCVSGRPILVPLAFALLVACLRPSAQGQPFQPPPVPVPPAVEFVAPQKIWIAGEDGVARVEPDERGQLRAVEIDVLPKGETNATRVQASADAIWLACVQHVVRVAADGKSAVWSTTERFGNIWWMD